MIRILVADDHENLHQQVKFLLSSLEHVSLVADAYSGREAIQLTRQYRPDLVLMDIRMPGMNGFETAHQLKVEYPKLIVIFLTNFDLEIYRDEAAAIGASGYVLKDNMFNTLLPAIIKAATANHQSEYEISMSESHPDFHRSA